VESPQFSAHMTLLPFASMLQMAQSLKQAEIEAKYKES
jgi:hypothetical protein